MIKKLTTIGNSLGLIIEKPIRELLDIDKDTPLEVKTDGEALVHPPRPDGVALIGQDVGASVDGCARAVALQVQHVYAEAPRGRS